MCECHVNRRHDCAIRSCKFSIFDICYYDFLYCQAYIYVVPAILSESVFAQSFFHCSILHMPLRIVYFGLCFCPFGFPFSCLLHSFPFIPFFFFLCFLSFRAPLLHIIGPTQACNFTRTAGRNSKIKNEMKDKRRTNRNAMHELKREEEIEWTESEQWLHNWMTAWLDKAVCLVVGD